MGIKELEETLELRKQLVELINDKLKTKMGIEIAEIFGVHPCEITKIKKDTMIMSDKKMKRYINKLK